MGGLSEFLGLKGGEGVQLGRGETPGVNLGRAVETGGLELERSKRNARCSGEMLRYRAEHRLRRRRTGSKLTLRHESVGIEQD